MAALILALVGTGCERGRAPARQLNVALALFPNEAANYRRFVRPFEAASGARVNLIAQSYGDLLDVLRASAGTPRGGALDLVELDLAMLGEARYAVRPLDAIVPRSARALFPAVAWDAATHGGRLYFVPHRLMWEAMIYNRREVRRPPATWDELARFAHAHPGKLALKAARYEGAVCDVMPFVWAAGGDALDPRAPGAREAFGFLSTLAPYLNPESAVFREMSVLEAQARGAVWIHFNWPFAIGYLASKGLAPGEDLSAPLPAGPDGRRATPLGGGYLAIPRSASHPELAAEFIRYLLTAGTQRRLSADLGWYGSVAPPAQSAEAALYAGFAAMRPYVRARPAIRCYTALSNRWQRALRALLFDGDSPSAALAIAAAGGTVQETFAGGCAAR
ncbi:MAG TPA: extracellular solute-binding protein [Candidatus Binataceae bacterium]|nr:extracellular solute-binding protein [Candidatus Binataceae bacterium]